MANRFTQLHIHFTFGVLYRERIINPEHSEELQKFITTVIQDRDHKMLSINNVTDHIHMLVGFNPVVSPADFVRDVKAVSSKFINQKSWMKSKFHWEEGYGAFSVSHWQISNVAKYIENQQKHHKTVTFSEEFENLLLEHEIPYDRKYIF